MSNANTRVERHRIDANRVQIATASGLDITLFANEGVPIDRASLADLAGLSSIHESVRELSTQGFFGDEGGLVRRCVLTPDFHRGAVIPVGTVLETDGLVFPRAVGGDVGCAMRLIATDLTREEFMALGPDLDRGLRHACFGGGRDLPLSERAREALLRHGAPGLVEVDRMGLWSGMDDACMEREVARGHRGSSWATDNLWMFGDYMRGSGGVSRDSVLGTIGGGNHFLEIQHIVERPDPGTAYAWGLHQGMVCIMIHTGSVGLGSQVGDHYMRVARELHPAGMAVPQHGFHPLPLRGPHAHHGRAYLNAMGLAANFAVMNRMALGLMALDCLGRACGRTVHGQLVHDVPHNLAWAEDSGRVVHRKGASPALRDMSDPQFPDGIPVIVPGSMGTESWVLRGLGNADALCSAPHGAGRVASRGQGRKGNMAELDALRVVTPLDTATIRRDIADELARDMLEEAPSVYKPVLPAIQTCRDAGMAMPVAVLEPLLTVKG